MGGLGVINIVEEAELDYTSLLNVNLHLTDNIREQIENPLLFNKHLTINAKRKNKLEH